MQQFNCVAGSSWTDVCLNTYGSLDNYVKLMNDNGVSPNELPASGQVISWDDSIVNNQTAQRFLNRNNTIFASLTGYGTPEQQSPTMSSYKDTLSTSYTATDPSGETVITLTELQGNEIVQIEQEIKPLKASEYIFNSVAGSITLVAPNQLEIGATLYIIYKKTVSV